MAERPDPMITSSLPLSSLLEEFIGSNDSTLDLNCNVVKHTPQTTTIPVIDICSDDDDSGLELGFKNVDSETSPANKTSPPHLPLYDNVKPTVSVPCYGHNRISELGSLTDYIDTPANISSNVFKTHESGSLPDHVEPYVLSCGSHKADESVESNSPNVSLSVENPLPSISELSRLGVKNVLASYLDYKPGSVEVTFSDCAPTSELSLSTSIESYIELDLSKTEEIEILQDGEKCPYPDEHSLSSLDSGTVPSPQTEAILLHESVQQISSGISTTPTSASIPILNRHKFQEVSSLESENFETPVPSATSNLEDLESPSSPSIGTSDSKLLITVAIPSPPPAYQLLEKEDEDSHLVSLTAACPSQSNIDETQNIRFGTVPNYESLGAIDVSEVSEVLAVSSQVPAESSRSEIETSDFILDEVLPLLLEAEAALNVDSEPVTEEHTAPISADIVTSQTQDAAQPKPSWAEPWISTDEAENADNNDPEWEIMRKLETDEERYRVVRNQWRQMSVPNPRRNLTSHYYKRNSQPRSSNVTNSFHNQEQSRKRARSNDDFTSDDHPSKRRRTYSCTQMFENKISSLHQQLDKDLEVLASEHERELFNLSDSQQQHTQRLMNSTAPYRIVKRQFDELVYYQEREVDGLKAKFDDKLHYITREKMTKIKILESAREEVLAFNKFYTDLGDSDDNDHCNISEEELQQFEETEQMFEAFDQIYNK